MVSVRGAENQNGTGLQVQHLQRHQQERIQAKKQLELQL